MAWLQYIKRLYSLDTLDTRFTIAATTPPRGAVTELQIDPAKPSPSSRSQSGGKADGITKPRQASDVQPSLWRTPEFYFYYFCFITIVPYMFKTGYDVSKGEIRMPSLCKMNQNADNVKPETHPAFPKYVRHLSQGWLFGRPVVIVPK
jgi:hypothetical protein